MVKRVPIKKITTEDEQYFAEAIKNFSCKDADVEKFLKEKAIDFDKRNRSRTYLLIDDDNKDEIIILGYFTITMKNLPFRETVSKSMIKKIDGYSNNVNSAEAILIGQLGKNEKYKNDIDGATIIKHVMEVVYIIHTFAGCRIVFLECFDNNKIVDFYTKHDFIYLQHSENDKYLQMVRYL